MHLRAYWTQWLLNEDLNIYKILVQFTLSRTLSTTSRFSYDENKWLIKNELKQLVLTIEDYRNLITCCEKWHECQFHCLDEVLFCCSSSWNIALKGGVASSNIDASVSSYIVRNYDSVQREYMEVGGVYTSSL
jgi:hypothetical protein